MKPSDRDTNKTTSVLLLDLEGTARRSLSFILGEKKYQVTEVDSLDTALSLLAECSIDVILINSGKDMSLCLEIVKEVKQNSPSTEIVVLTASYARNSAMSTLQNGAFDCLDASAAHEEIMFKLRKAGELSKLKRRLFALREEVALSKVIGDIGLALDSHPNGDDITGGSSTLPQKNKDGVKVPSERRTGNGLLRDSQQAIIEKVLADNNWNFTHTASELGIGRTTLWRKMKKYNLKRQLVV